jgi:C_GCAxxG_C_C family probable redox protein
MPIYDAMVFDVSGPEERAAYSLAVPPEEARLRLLDVVAKSAFNNLRAYSNCCRSTLWALQTHLHLQDEGTFRASTCLAGGIAGSGETCGAVLGGMIAIGLALGSDRPGPREREIPARTSTKAFIDAFVERIGSTRCYHVQEALIGWRCDDASKAEAWHDASGSVACASVCGFAARIAAEQILAQWDQRTVSPMP